MSDQDTIITPYGTAESALQGDEDPDQGARPDGSPGGDESPRRRARRRLIKGLLAAGAGAALPTVLTLRNGARAADISNLSCIYPLPTAHTAVPLAVRCNSAGVDDEFYRLTRASFPGNTDRDTTVLTGGDNSASDLCVVYVDETTGFINTAEVQQWGQGQAGHHVITDSCWTSVMLPEGGP